MGEGGRGRGSGKIRKRREGSEKDERGRWNLQGGRR